MNTFVHPSRILSFHCGLIRIAAAAAGLILFFGSTQNLGSFPEGKAVLTGTSGWTSGGPPGGYVNDLAIAPSDSDVIYAATSNGVYKSLDSGAAWTCAGLVGTGIGVIRVDPANPDIVYAGAEQENGFYKSTNGGGDWTQGTIDQVLALAIDPSNAQVLWAGTKAGRIYRSGNRGDTWTEKHHETHSTWDVPVNSIVVDPENSSTVFAGLGGASRLGGYNGFLKSINGGDTWVGSHIGATSPWDFGESLVITPSSHSPQTLYVISQGSGGYGADVFRSTNKGGSWEELYLYSGSITNSASTLCVDPVDPDWLYVGTTIDDFPLLAWEEVEDQWYNAGSGLPARTPTCVAVDPESELVVFTGIMSDTLYKSTNFGNTWHECNSGLVNSEIDALAVSPADSNAAFAGIEGGGFRLQTTTDGGDTWSAPGSNPPLNVNAVAFDPGNANVLFAGTTHFFRSPDGGGTWTDIDSLSYGAIHDIWVHPTSPNIVLAISDEYDNGVYTYYGGVWRNTAGGATGDWDLVTKWWRPTCLASDPSNPQIVYLGTQSKGYVKLSPNAGLDWADISPSTEWVDTVYDLVVDSDSNLYAATSDGIWKRSGTSWSQLTWRQGAAVTALAVDTGATPDTLYAGTDDAGVFMSQTGGVSWSGFSTGLEVMSISQLQLSPTSPKILYAGTEHGGVWTRSLISGPTHTLTIVVNGQGDTVPAAGSHIYGEGATAQVSAQADSGYVFSQWSGDVPAGHQSDNPVSITMDADKSITANFYSATAPVISTSRTALYFGADTLGNATEAQLFGIINSGGGTLDWSVSDNAAWLACSPASGSGDGLVSVSVDPSGLGAGGYTGIVTIGSLNAANAPRTVSVVLTVEAAGNDSPPFGSFDTPIHGSTVMSSVPVTGWVLDDIGTEDVRLYRNPVSGEPDTRIYIGDAVFVEGARTDVELAYPNYPLCNKAGWGYMMLTNFLPNQGNGTFILYAVARDGTGHEVTLGSKTITCDNANAVKPFGAIDTPAQGSTAAGNAYFNFGWALTPIPQSIPTDGTTLNVFVDGVNLGHPVYNNYRADIATLFPGYANSDGAVGYYVLDTTAFANGVHTIAWGVTDSAGQADGIGSRYFNVSNGSAGMPAGGVAARGKPVHQATGTASADLFFNGTRIEPVYVTTGVEKWFDTGRPLAPDANGIFELESREVERVVLSLGTAAAEGGLPSRPGSLGTGGNWRGWLVVGDELRPLPIGSTLDRRAGVFYWQPGPGFLGDYLLLFQDRSQDGRNPVTTVRIRIRPQG